MYNEDVKYAADRLMDELVGFTIVGVVMSHDPESYGFRVQRPRGGTKVEKKVVWVDCDPEGNGPGWLSIEASS